MKTSARLTVILLTMFVMMLAASQLFAGLNLRMLSTLSTQTGINYDIASPFYYLMYIIIAGLLLPTAAILLLIKYRKLKVINIAMMVLFVLVMYSFSSTVLLDAYIFALHGNMNAGSATLAILSLLVYTLPFLLAVYYFRYAGKNGKNLMNLIVFISISAIISLYLNVLTAMILIAVISIYDYIAVFVTKHMITLADAFSGNSFGGISLMAKKTRKKGIFLGGGDMVFPAILANEFFLHYSALSGIFVAVGAVVGLSMILFFGRKDRVYPAMAVIGPMQFIFIGLYFLPGLLLGITAL